MFAHEIRLRAVQLLTARGLAVTQEAEPDLRGAVDRMQAIVEAVDEEPEIDVHEIRLQCLQLLIGRGASIHPAQDPDLREATDRLYRIVRGEKPAATKETTASKAADGAAGEQPNPGQGAPKKRGLLGLRK